MKNIKKVHFDDHNSVFKDYNFENEQNNRELEFNRINIFVGANNSGKSRFLRELFKQHRKKELNGQFDNIDFQYKKINTALKIFEPVFKSYLETNTEESVVEADKEYISKNRRRFESPKHYNSLQNEFIKVIDDIPPSKFEGYLSFNEYRDIIYDMSLVKSGETKIVEPHNDLFIETQDNEKKELNEFSYSTYIPILRTLKKVSPGIELLFRKRTYIDYFTELDSEKETNIFTGEDLYSTIDKTIKSPKKREITLNFFKNL